MLKIDKEKLIMVNVLLLMLTGIGIGFIIWGEGMIEFISVAVLALIAWIASDLARQVVALKHKDK